MEREKEYWAMRLANLDLEHFDSVSVEVDMKGMRGNG